MSNKYINGFLEDYENRVKQLDKTYPNRHKEIHKTCCKNCPSNNNKLAGIKDPETEEYKTLPKEVLAKEYVFLCAWRNSKLCKGICDDFGVDEEYIKSVKK